MPSEGFDALLPRGDPLPGNGAFVVSLGLDISVHRLYLALHQIATAVRDFFIHLCYFAKDILCRFAMGAEVSVCGHI